METWEQMTERHKRERFKLVAKKLDMSLQALNNFVKRNNIHWWVIKQGQRSEKT